MNNLIDRRIALGIILAQAAGHMAITLKVVTEANAKIADLQERIHVLREISDFMLDRADGETVVELRKKMDYWFIVLGFDPEVSES